MKEVLKLALEALECALSDDKPYIVKSKQAITAIKAALAQQDGQSNFCAQCEAFARELKAVKQERGELKAVKQEQVKPAQREPVSVTYKEVADAMNSLWNGTLEQHQIAEQMANKKLYTTPAAQPAQEPEIDLRTRWPMSGWKENKAAPQQRHWVDLTEDEMDNVRRSMGYNQFMSAGEYAKLVQFVTQARLKDKNNG